MKRIKFLLTFLLVLCALFGATNKPRFWVEDPIDGQLLVFVADENKWLNVNPDSVSFAILQGDSLYISGDVRVLGDIILDNSQWIKFMNSLGDTANVMTLDTDDVIKLGQESEFGLHEFVPNSGYVPALDMQITPDAIPGNPYGYYFSVDSTKFLEIRGVANASGGLDSVHVSSPTYFSGKKCGAFAILTAQDTTTITTADTYQYVEGVFNDVLAEDFTQITVNTDEPAMRYDGDIEQWFKLDWSTNISGDSPNINAVLNFSLNGTPCPCTYKPVFCSSAGVPYAASSMAVVKLKKGDWIQLIVKTDDAGDEVTFYDFQLTICEFFD